MDIIQQLLNPKLELPVIGMNTQYTDSNKTINVFKACKYNITIWFLP